MLQNNPYSVLLETISFENVQKMGELITLKTLKTQYAYTQGAFNQLYVGLVKDLNRCNNSRYIFSDAYDLVQTAICFLCEFTHSLQRYIEICHSKWIDTKQSLDVNQV